jgi:hypothetical protein
MNIHHWPRLAVCLVVLALTACGGGGGGGGGAPAPAPTYSLSASVSGLSGTGLSLELNKAAAVAIAANGSITLGAALAAGATYQVTVAGSPVNPMQTCTVASPSGTIEAASVTLAVSCSTDPVQTAIPTGLDSALPQATVSMVAKVITAGGSGALGAWVPRGSPNSNGETLLLGVDANSHIVAAAITAANDGTMSADSTALVFVRMLIAEKSTSLTATQVNAQIRASANFPPLVQAIDADLKAQKLPLSDPSIVAMMVTLANGTAAALPAAAGSRARVKASVSVPVGPWQSGTQFTIIAGGPTYITSSGSPTGQLVNELAIPWSVSESQGTASLLGTQIVPGGGTLAVPISNSPFHLTLGQTGTTLGMIANDFSFGLYQSFSTIATATIKAIPACTTSFSTALLSLTQKVGNQTTNPALLFTNTIDQITTPFIVNIITGCAPTLATQAVNIATLYTTYDLAWLDITKAVELGSTIPLLAVSSLDFVKEIVAANLYADNTYDLEICANVTYTITSCVASLTISGANTKQYLAPGATITPLIQGFAADGTSTVLPAALQVTFDQTVLTASQTNGLLSITALEPAPGAALPGSSVSVTVTEPYSGASASVPVWIVLPILQPPQRVFSVAPTPIPVTIQLIDPNGNPIAVPNGITYDKKTTALSTQFVFNSASGGNSNWTIPANASPLGNFNVIATDPAGIDYPSLSLTLQGPAPGTCVPPAGATTCAITLYSIPDSTHSGFGAPVPGIITTVQIDNGVTNTSVNTGNPLGVTIYDNVNGPPLNAPPCTYIPGGGCPALVYHNFQLCAVDGKYTPVTYNSVVSDQVVLEGGCTGSPGSNNIITGYTLSADGVLTGTDSSTASQNRTCTSGVGPNFDTTTATEQDLKNDPISMNLKDGSGHASVSETRQFAATDALNPNGNIVETTTVTGTQSWPAESVSPPQFSNTGITATTTYVPAGQALPQACTVGTP